MVLRPARQQARCSSQVGSGSDAGNLSEAVWMGFVMTITVAKLKRAAEELRDELTNEKATGALVYPFAMDVLATTPGMLTRLAAKLSEE